MEKIQKIQKKEQYTITITIQLQVIRWEYRGRTRKKNTHEIRTTDTEQNHITG